MSENLKIKLSIANRLYPLTIRPNQEQGLRLAAQKINETLKQFEESYSVKDKQDVLAMCALKFATQLEQSSINKENTNREFEERLNKINNQLINYFETNEE
tara:strand:+ start:180 stop:482 length:303 start_codon:yes stop_codon:yes gene_type:complete